MFPLQRLLEWRRILRTFLFFWWKSASVLLFLFINSADAPFSKACRTTFTLLCRRIALYYFISLAAHLYSVVILLFSNKRKLHSVPKGGKSRLLRHRSFVSVIVLNGVVNRCCSCWCLVACTKSNTIISLI
uniref:AlNc14C108G6284 protein n=1 Tax=Albugo laibachii Nc14 TaxID=890382 RepID=F0WI77_9STRA|nr:AlNc14C108G6284 [Albugo laibachii Nc14]|eukprot:CCA20956.1 AlNc14C108G6284 [Albugo laibachii Nc14]